MWSWRTSRFLPITETHGSNYPCQGMVSWARPLRRTSSIWPKWAKSTRLRPHSLVILPLEAVGVLFSQLQRRWCRLVCQGQRCISGAESQLLSWQRGGSSRGSWFSTQTQSTNAHATGPPAKGPQWLSQGECGLQIHQSRSDKFPNSETGSSGRRKAGIFSARMGIYNVRQMGFRRNSTWLRARLLRYASLLHRYSKNKNALSKTT